MSKRTEAVVRLTLGTLWFIAATAVMAFIWLPIAVLLGAIDIILQLVFNNEGLDTGVVNSFMQMLGWYLDGTEWWLAGQDEMNLLPYAGV